MTTHWFLHVGLLFHVMKLFQHGGLFFSLTVVFPLREQYEFKPLIRSFERPYMCTLNMPTAFPRCLFKDPKQALVWLTWLLWTCLGRAKESFHLGTEPRRLCSRRNHFSRRKGFERCICSTISHGILCCIALCSLTRCHTHTHIFWSERSFFIVMLRN